MSTEETTPNTCNCATETEEHSCPYQSDINGNDEFTCTCCAECTHQCAMDI